MPLYEYRRNAENHLQVDDAIKDSLVVASKQSLTPLSPRSLNWLVNVVPVFFVMRGTASICLQCMQCSGGCRSRRLSLTINIISSHTLFQTPQQIDDYRKPYVGEDPSFGWVNDSGMMADILDTEAVAQVASNNAKPRRLARCGGSWPGCLLY